MNALWLMAALFVLWQVWEQLSPRLRCDYCGTLCGHEPDCPWNLDREERSD